MSLRRVPDAPCKGCDERELGCHSHCIAYKQWYTRYRARKESFEADREALYEQERDLHWETWRKKGGQW